ncbi:MAG: hypothetical protein LAQ30_16615 [Acidobacteriia bacterium]|nr:hypothetical protein [Terriglobia bacterium]
MKRVQDAFDTDYVLPGRSLGDIVVRYRAAGATEWQQVSNAGPIASGAAGSSVAYHIGRAVPTVATASGASSSIVPPAGRGGNLGGRGGAATSALNDQLEPENSHDPVVPLFAWTVPGGGREWVQYDFAAPQRVSSVEPSPGACNIGKARSGKRYGHRACTAWRRTGSITSASSP